MTETPRQKRFRSIQQLFEMYELEPEHTEHVRTLALQLFDQLFSLHGLAERERDYLEAAALLHDIGWSQSSTGHHKESMKLILKSDLPHWLDEEKQVIAQIARYHRKASPKPKHKRFAALRPAHQIMVRKLAALLRIADGLDRSHRAVIQQVRCRIDTDTVLLSLLCQAEVGLELYGLDKKKDLFRQTYHKDILIDTIQHTWDVTAEG